ncbi:hypothetical protein ACFL2S_12765, partial [Thermodesulfobacteriota bacterium]
NGTYGANGGPNCDCPQGYTWATGNTHCEKLKPPGEICARDFPGSVFNGTYGANGGPNCDCPQGYPCSLQGDFGGTIVLNTRAL